MKKGCSPLVFNGGRTGPARLKKTSFYPFFLLIILFIYFFSSHTLVSIIVGPLAHREDKYRKIKKKVVGRRSFLPARYSAQNSTTPAH